MNLPVKNVQRSREFFSAIGFGFRAQMSSAHSLCMTVSEKNIVFMLFEEPMFRGFTNGAVCDTREGSEVLISFSAESREQVDEMAAKVKAAGGHIYGGPGDNQGWMYGMGFTDPDGHKWNMLYMDRSKMPQ